MYLCRNGQKSKKKEETFISCSNFRNQRKITWKKNSPDARLCLEKKGGYQGLVGWYCAASLERKKKDRKKPRCARSRWNRFEEECHQD